MQVQITGPLAHQASETEQPMTDAKAPTTVASLRDTEPDYRSLVATLDALRRDTLALVLLRTSLPLISGSGNVPRGCSCTLAFFADTREPLRRVMSDARRYAADMHHADTQRRARAEYRISECAIVSDAQTWLFVDAHDGMPVLPMSAAAGTKAAASSDQKAPASRWVSSAARALERRTDDPFYDKSLADAMSSGAIRSSPLDRHAALSAVRNSDHGSRPCMARVRAARTAMLPCTAHEASCACGQQPTSTCGACERAIAAELDALADAYADRARCSGRDNCSCIADVAVRAAVAHNCVIEIGAVLSSTDCAYAALGDDIYDQNSPLVVRTLAAYAARGVTVPRTTLPGFAVASRLLASAQRRETRRFDLRCASYEAVRRATGEHRTLAQHVVETGAARNRQPIERALDWLPPFAAAMLRPYAESGAYRLLSAEMDLLSKHRDKCAALADNGLLERALYEEVARDGHTRRAFARVVGLCVQTPRDYDEFIYVAAVLALMVHVLEFAAATCRRRADVERRLAAECERRKRAAAAAARPKPEAKPEAKPRRTRKKRRVPTPRESLDAHMPRPLLRFDNKDTADLDDAQPALMWKQLCFMPRIAMPTV